MARRFDMNAWLRWFAARSELLMFNFALAYLVCLAVLVVVWVDVPGLHDRASKAIQSVSGKPSEVTPLASPVGLEGVILTAMFGIWVITIGESIVHWCTRPWHRGALRYHWFSLLFCICPALRMCARSPEMNDRIWLPGYGWRRGDRRLQRQLERAFSVPMMVIALLIMPILITEFFLKDQVAAYRWLRLLLHIGTGVIWFAFAAEFILMVSIAERKIEYCKEHWIDLAIILLPIVSFLRSLSLARTMKIANLMRIQQLTNLARAYRLRGTAIKALRVLILFDLTERLLRTSDTRKIQKLEEEIAETEKQARLLRQRLAKIKLRIAEESAGEAEDGCSS